MASVLYTAFDVVPSPKGASTHIAQFVKGLVRAGYDLHLITAGDGSLPEEDSYLGASVRRVVSAGTNYLERALAFGQAVSAHLDDEGERYALAHFRSIWSGLPLVAAQPRCGYRTLFEVNGLPSIELKYHYPPLAGSPALEKIKRQEIATLLRADHVICPSAVTAAYITSLGILPERVTVIHNGVDPELFAPVPPGGSPGPPVLLYVGTLALWQGLETLLLALPLILAERAVQLRIVGKGRKDRAKALRKRVRKMGLDGHVTLAGPLPHHIIPQIVAEATICVAPLAFNDRNVTQGCCPIKVLEYAACARPLVAANLPVARELVRDESEALLFNPDDPADLARCVLALLADPERAAQMARRASERVRQEFSWKAAQKKLLKVYGRLLAGPKRRPGSCPADAPTTDDKGPDNAQVPVEWYNGPTF
jgi:glycosyltransferase involved in cell wall biosynthesis